MQYFSTGNGTLGEKKDIPEKIMGISNRTDVRFGIIQGDSSFTAGCIKCYSLGVRTYDNLWDGILMNISTDGMTSYDVAERIFQTDWTDNYLPIYKYVNGAMATWSYSHKRCTQNCIYRNI